MNLHELGIRLDARGAIRTLNQFTGSAHNAGRATEHFERTTKNLTSALGALGGYFGVRQLVEYADTWTLINARVRLVTSSTEQAMAVQQELSQIANQTRNTLAATSVLYTRVALNADQLGRSHRELLTMVESVNAAMLLSGATGVEAAQAMRQLAQALGSGRVQGDEFRTMMEAMPLVARAIADEMGVALGDLYKLSRQGLIDVQTVIDALIKKNAELMAGIEDMPFTVGQAFEVLNNSFSRMTGIINMAFGVTDRLAAGVLKLGENLDKVFAAVGALVSAVIAYRVALLGATAIQAIFLGARRLQGWIELSRYIGRAAAAMRLLQITSRGVAGILAMVTAATIGFLAYKKLLEEITQATDEWINAQGNLNEKLGEGAERLDEQTIRVRNQIEDMIRLAHQQVVLSGVSSDQQEELEIRFEAVNKRIEARRELQGELLQAMIAAIGIEERLKLEALGYARALTEVEKALKERQQIIEQFAKNLQRSLADVFESIFEDGIEKFEDLFESIKRLFFRFVAEMSAARIMEKLGPSFTGALGSVFGTTQQAAALQHRVDQIARMAQSHMPEATSPDGTIPVQIEGITVTAEKSFASTIAQFLGPVLAGFFIGRIAGGMTTSTGGGILAGAASGAATGALIGSAIPGVGTGIGAVAGGIAGAIGGWMGARDAAERLRQQLEANKQVIEANNRQLQDLRDAFSGRSNRTLLQARGVLAGELPTAQSVPEGWEGFESLFRGVMQDVNIRFHQMSDSEKGAVLAIAQQLGIELFDQNGRLLAGALDQLSDAIELTIRSLTQFGNNLRDVTARQEAYNKLFDVEESPLRKLQDTQSLLNTLAPELMDQLGLTHLNLSSPEARATFLEGLREIFRMIENGDFTNDPALLGAFENKDQLIDAIIRAKDALDELAKVIFDVVTDFPRAMDIAYYEQLYGRYTPPGEEDGAPRDDRPPKEDDEDRREDRERRRRRGDEHGTRFSVAGDVNIINEAGDTGEVLLTKLERAVLDRRTLGGSVDLDKTDETLF